MCHYGSETLLSLRCVRWNRLLGNPAFSIVPFPLREALYESHGVYYKIQKLCPGRK